MRVGSKADDHEKDQSRRSRSKADDPWVEQTIRAKADDLLSDQADDQKCNSP